MSKKIRETEMWKEYDVTMTFTGRLCGSVPLSKKIIPNWLESRKPKKEPEDARSLEDIEKEVLESIEDVVERTTLGFQHDNMGFWLRGGNVKSHLKDCGNQIKYALGLTALKAKVANAVYINEYKIHILKDGKHVNETDGQYEQPVHAWTPQGQINALKNIHYIKKGSLSFRIRVLKFKDFDIDVLEKIFDYGSIHGFGGERSLGEGRYTYTIDPVEA